MTGRAARRGLLALVVGLSVLVPPATGGPVGAQDQPAPDSAFGNGMFGLSAGRAHTCALTGPTVVLGGPDRLVRCFGAGDQGQLGNGRLQDSATPVGVVGLSGRVKSVSAGGAHSCAVLTDETVRCWGDNDSGQLGDGTTADSSVPVVVVGISGALSVSAGDNHTCASTAGQGIACWGDNSFGQLGDGTSVDSPLPRFPDASGTVSAGATHSCANNSDVATWCWGDNTFGQLGDGTNLNSSQPVVVSGLSNVWTVTAGDRSSCALSNANGLACWGKNNRGQLGDQTTIDSNMPVVAVPPEDTNLLFGVDLGGAHTCFGWGGACLGANGSGQLGDGTTNDRSTPTGPLNLFTSRGTATAGQAHTCGVEAPSGSGFPAIFSWAKCWGANERGQLGVGTTSAMQGPSEIVAGACRSPQTTFSDVPEEALFRRPSSWMADTGITTGTSPGIYSPLDTVTRKQMAVFLWRAAGQPAGAPPHSFDDIPAGAYYTDAVSWAVDAGVTTGTSAASYSPNAPVTRAQTALFLHRTTGLLQPSTPHTFTDVASTGPVPDAVSWLAEANITQGTGNGLYSPNQPVIRSDMAYFMYRRECGTPA